MLPKGIRVADTASDLRRVETLRYRVYVEEFGRLAHRADHERRLLVDCHDESAMHLLAESGGVLAGCVRVHLHCVPRELDGALELQRFPSESIALVSKLMVPPEFRRSTVVGRLFQALFRIGADAGIELVLCTTFPHLVPLYERIGFSKYKDFLDPELGPHCSMRTYLDDPRHREGRSIFRFQTARQEPGCR